MKINEIITEVFNPETSFPIEWDDRHGPEEMHGRAYDRQGGFIDIKFIALRNGVVEVEFSRNDSYDMTGAGDANRVLATILEAFREYLRGYQPKIFVFSAKGGSRSRVYQSMIQRFAAGAGYKQFDTAKLSDKARKQLGHSGSDVMVLRRAAVDEDRHPNDKPYGPETKPTMPKGTVRVDVSDVYDWYKLGMNISNLDKADKSQFGKGPPSTIVSFGDEDTEHKYIKNLEKLGLTTTDIDPVDPNQPRGMKRQKTDPTFNVNEEQIVETQFAVNRNPAKGLWQLRMPKAGAPLVDETEFVVLKDARPWQAPEGKEKLKITNFVVGDETDEKPQGEGRQIGYIRGGDDPFVYMDTMKPYRGSRYAVFDDRKFLAFDSLEENFADGKVKGKSRPGRVKRAGASCNGSVTSLRQRAKNASGEKAKMYHWCANMKSGRNK